MRQEGNLKQLIWKVPEMIAFLSGLFELKPGDLIFNLDLPSILDSDKKKLFNTRLFNTGGGL